MDAATHEDNFMCNFRREIKTTKLVTETAYLLTNEPWLEESAMKNQYKEKFIKIQKGIKKAINMWSTTSS